MFVLCLNPYLRVSNFLYLNVNYLFIYSKDEVTNIGYKFEIKKLRGRKKERERKREKRAYKDKKKKKGKGAGSKASKGVARHSFEELSVLYIWRLVQAITIDNRPIGTTTPRGSSIPFSPFVDL